jgi:hypothetical protein
LAGLEFELRALHLARQELYCLSHASSTTYLRGFFKVIIPFYLRDIVSLYIQGWPKLTIPLHHLTLPPVMYEVFN